MRRRLRWRSLAAAIAFAQAPRSVTVYEGARLILGDARPPIENGVFVVDGGRISRRRCESIGCSPARRRARRPDRQDGDAGDDQRARPHRLRGLHQLGRGELHAAERSRSPSARSVLRRRRDTVGRQQPDRAGASVPAGSTGGQVSARLAIFLHARHGAAQRRPGCRAAGRDHALHVVNEVSTPEEARRAVRAMAAQRIRSVKIWDDDRRGTYPKLSPETCPRDHRRGARAPDAGQRPRDDAARSEGSGARRRRRARPPGPERKARRRISVDPAREEAGTGRRSSGSAIAPRSASRIRSSRKRCPRRWSPRFARRRKRARSRRVADRRRRTLRGARRSSATTSRR